MRPGAFAGKIRRRPHLPGAEQKQSAGLVTGISQLQPLQEARHLLFGGKLVRAGIGLAGAAGNAARSELGGDAAFPVVT